MKAPAAVLLVLVLLPVGARAEQADHGFDAQLQQAGDTLQFGVPLVALGLTFLLDGEAEAGDATGYANRFDRRFGLNAFDFYMNGSPRHDLMLAIGRTELATYSLKYGVNEPRPNGHGESFPSGHTSIAFAGAEFIRKRYGWGYGLPAYLSAGVVGWSRVEARYHWTHDVLAGAAIGILSNHDSLTFDLGGSGMATLSLAPGLVSGNGALSFAPPDSIRAQFEQSLEQPALGLRLEVRF